MAGLLLKPTRCSSAANVHAIRIGTLPVADRVMTVRRPCNPLVAAARCARRDRRELVRSSAALLEWRVSSLPRVPAKSPDWPDSGHAAVSTGASLHAPFLPLPPSSTLRRSDFSERGLSAAFKKGTAPCRSAAPQVGGPSFCSPPIGEHEPRIDDKDVQRIDGEGCNGCCQARDQDPPAAR